MKKQQPSTPVTLIVLVILAFSFVASCSWLQDRKMEAIKSQTATIVVTEVTAFPTQFVIDYERYDINGQLLKEANRYYDLSRMTFPRHGLSDMGPVTRRTKYGYAEFERRIQQHRNARLPVTTF